MTTRINPNVSVFDHGIEAILRDVEDFAPLPSAEIGPASSPLKPQLEKLFEMPNLEDYIRQELAPMVAESALLLPYRFRQAVGKARARLLAAAVDEPRHGRVYGRAAAVLEDQSEMFSLIQEYRLALVQG